MEHDIVAGNGITYAALAWGSKADAHTRVLGFHGWLDNAATFTLLGPRLAAAGYYVVAVDFSGHGRSTHRPPHAEYTMVTYAEDVMAVAEALGWKAFVFLGHSLGGAVGTLIAACFPDAVTALVCIDITGAMARAPDTAPEVFKQALLERLRPPSGRETVYATVEDAVARRVDNAAKLFGNQRISQEGATALVQRGLKPAASGTARCGLRRRTKKRKSVSVGVMLLKRS